MNRLEEFYTLETRNDVNVTKILNKQETVRRVRSRISLRSVLRQQCVFEGEGGSSEFFQVPEPKWRRQLEE